MDFKLKKRYAVLMKNKILISLFACIFQLNAHEITDQSFNKIYTQSSPAVVSIHTAKKISTTPFYDSSYAAEDQKLMKSGLGSGVIISDDGYILTNYHVIAGKDAIQIHLTDGGVSDAILIGSDQRTDLALLKIKMKQLTTLNIGNSDKIKVGDWAIAIGNPFGLRGSLTVGVISAIGRSDMDMNGFSDLIQTDVAINPGNSGGALLNSKGELIGINSAVFSQNGEYSGISFSIPINMAIRVMTDLKKFGYVQRGWLGVGIRPLTNNLRKKLNFNSTHGAYVGEISTNSNAFIAGLRQGDIIVSFNDKPIVDYHALRYRVAESTIGEVIKLNYFRLNQIKTISFLLENPPNKLN